MTPKKRTPSTESSPLLPYELTTPEEDAMLDEFLRNQPPDVVFIVQFLRKKIRMLEDALLDRDRRILELERQNAEMANTIADMALQIAELKARLDMHSRNSSKPPSCFLQEGNPQSCKDFSPAGGWGILSPLSAHQGVSHPVARAVE